uniref:LisH domain-containing protein n=1 Tax=Caenorhabditis tropicalis TaxID=1561998 RepID=A0A1I7TSV8_9PELO
MCSTTTTSRSMPVSMPGFVLQLLPTSSTSYPILPADTNQLVLLWFLKRMADEEGFPDEPVMEEGNDSDNEVPEQDDRDDMIDMDSPSEDGDGDLNHGRLMAFDYDDDYRFLSSEGEGDDALTWDTASEASEKEEDRTPVDDEWYPLAARSLQFPNFALPTTTRPALLRQTSSRSFSPSSDTFSDCGDVDFMSYMRVMRPTPSRKDFIRLVLDYFLHYGHSEVIEIFCKEMNVPLPLKDIEEMNSRNEIRDLIWAGKMEEAIQKMPPSILDDDDVNFAVRKQHIIEMIREGQMQEPITYFRKYLMKGEERPNDQRMEIIERVFALMVFSADDETEFAYYLDQKERESTAKLVNSAILGEKGKSKSSQIELLAKTICYVQSVVQPKYMRKQVLPPPKEWAEKYFSTPFGFQELIEKVPKHGQYSLNDSHDLC